MDSARAVQPPRSRTAPPVSDAKDAISVRPAGYGLPCARCKTYFAADLSVCPICKCSERVSPTAPASTHNGDPTEPAPDLARIEEERERFLREFKLQVYAGHMQFNAAASLSCSVEANHQGAFEPAEVCKACYDRLQQRVDLMEAALHMDLKEAAQVIYNAVWSDASDPNQSYQNAALALLTELRKRAGISLMLGSMQPLTH